MPCVLSLNQIFSSLTSHMIRCMFRIFFSLVCCCELACAQNPLIVYRIVMGMCFVADKAKIGLALAIGMAMWPVS